jgi:hypothetical protein
MSCFRYWTRHCCSAEGLMIFSPWGVVLEFLVAFSLMMAVMVLSPLELAVKAQWAPLIGVVLLLGPSCLSCMDDWSPQVAAMTNRRRKVYWVLCTPFFFLFIVMALFRALS